VLVTFHRSTEACRIEVTRTPSIVGIKNCALWSSVVPAVHQLAYRPSVQHVIDLTSGYTKNGVGNPIPISMIEDKPWDHLMIGSNTVLASAGVALQLRCNLIGDSSMSVIAIVWITHTFSYSTKCENGALALKPIRIPEFVLEGLEHYVEKVY
jgi:hypothetical protein